MIGKSLNILLVALLVCNSQLQAQEGKPSPDPGLKLGVDIKYRGGAYHGGKVFISKNGSPFDVVALSSSSEFSYLFEYGARYLAEFTGEGLASKTLEIDLKSVPEHELKTQHDWRIGELSLFKAHKEMNLAPLSEPVGRIHYSDLDQNFAIDYKYAASRRFELEKLENHAQELDKAEKVELKSKEKEFDSVMKEAKNLYAQKNYELALSKYVAASAMLPDRTEPKEGITEINSILQEEKKYNDVVLAADALFNKQEWVAARDKYVLATGMKPTASYPKTQLSKIAQVVQQEEEKSNTFNNYLAMAEKAYSEGNYAVASENYTKALGINPDAAMAKKKLQQAKEKQAVKEKTEQNQNEFNALLAKAKDARMRGDLEGASVLIALAEQKIPGNQELAVEKEVLMKKKADANERLMAEKKAKDDNDRFQELIDQSKNATDRKNYSLALSLLDQANLIKPDDPIVLKERNFINESVADEKQRELLAIQELEAKKEREEEASRAMVRAKEAEEKGDMKNAVFLYKKAYELNPAVSASKERAIELEKLMVESAAATNSEKSDDNELDKMDKKSDAFVTALAKKYPEGITEEKFKEGNKEITKRYKVENGRGTEYMVVRHSWGGVFYFKNGEPITQNIYELETK
ncbi:MAG: hypothetical protein KDC83_02925 [Flavobacteriales bacterium]|nr:hypothetical protein [Flavobacteriales bacterium]